MECPHCHVSVWVEEVNCAIFRCGIVKATGEQVPPHLPKEECDRLGDTIWGCSKPFQLGDGALVKCDFI